MNKPLGLICCALFFSASPALAAEGGIYLGGTRLIYPAQNKSVNIAVTNSASNTPVLVQAWVTNAYPGDKKAPFIVTPPLYRQDKGSNTLRVSFVGGALPRDRESVFFLNVRAIPATPKDTRENSVTLRSSFTNRIKIFYRPSDLPGNADEAYKQLTFSRTPTGFTVTNPSTYYVSLDHLSVNGKDISEQSNMIEPFGHQNYRALGVSDIKYAAINDYGGITDEMDKKVQ